MKINTCLKIIVYIWALFLNIGCITYGNEMSIQLDASEPVIPKTKGNKYFNWIPTPKVIYSIPKLIWHNLSNSGERKKPENTISAIHLSQESFSKIPSSGLTFRWLGHSSLFLEMNGFRFMIDPMLSTYASPVPGFVKRFSEIPISLSELPHVDFVLISHNHYDHLDKSTVSVLAEKKTTFFVPLGVKAELIEWGISEQQIKSLNWWQETQFKNLKIVSVPARHFSNRGLFDGNETLWSGWVVVGPQRKIFYSGDSGYGNHLKEIGNRLGPFDLAMIENGAYNEAWPYVHSNAENAVQACIDVKAKLFLPVHWATFDLSIHSWDEPIIRAVAEAEKRNIKITTPRIGELVDIEKPIHNTKWWINVK